MNPTDEQIVAQAKIEGQRTGIQAFSELARSHNGVNSPYGMGFIDGAVWCREYLSYQGWKCKCKLRRTGLIVEVVPSKDDPFCFTDIERGVDYGFYELELPTIGEIGI